MPAAGPGPIRVLHLLGRSPDFPTERAAAALRQGLGAGFNVTTHAIGRGGDYRNALSAILGLRGRSRESDLIHAWDETALAAAAVSGAGRILYTPMHPLGRRSI